LSAAAAIVGIKCTIVAPHDAPAVKISKAAANGADIVYSTAPTGENREVCLLGRKRAQF